MRSRRRRVISSRLPRLAAVAVVGVVVALAVDVSPALSQTPAQTAAVQAGCDRAAALLNAGYVTDAETVLKSQLGVDNANPCTTTLLTQVFAARTAKTPTQYFNIQVQVIRALEAAGFETEARNQAQALIEANPNRPIPADIRGLNQRLGLWRGALGDVAPWYRSLLEFVIVVLAVVAAVFLIFQAGSALWHRVLPATYTIGTVTGIGADDTPKQTGLLKAELAGLSDRTTGAAPVRRAASDEQAFSLPAGITSAIPNAQLLAGLVSLLDRLLPRRLTKVNVAALPSDASRGIGVTVQVAKRSGRSRAEKTLWESDFFPVLGSPNSSGPEPDAGERLGRMLLPAAVWLAYQPKLQKGRRGTPVSTRDWESYAHFAVAERAQRDGNVTLARRSYYKALDKDPTNTFAMLNLAGLKLYPDTATLDAGSAQAKTGKAEPAQGVAGAKPAGGGAKAPVEDDAERTARLDFAQWLLVAARTPQQGSEASTTQLRWLYLGATYGLYRPNLELASRFAQALWKQLEPKYEPPAGEAAIAPNVLYGMLKPDDYRPPEATDQGKPARPANPDVRASVMDNMRVPAWILLQSAMLETGESSDIDAHVANAWWSSNTLYNLACFHARVAAKKVNTDKKLAAENLATAIRRLRDAIDRADEPELLLIMASSDPALVKVYPDVEAQLHPKPPEPDYNADAEVGRGWGVRFHEAVKAGILGQRNGETPRPLLEAKAGASAAGEQGNAPLK